MQTRLTGIHVPQKYSSMMIKARPPLAWLELNTDEYIEETADWLIAQKLREDYPISLRGMGLSLASADTLNWQYLSKLKALKAAIDPCLIADQLAWSSVNGQYFHVPLPMLYSEEMLNQICMKIEAIQDYLQTPLLVENIPTYEIGHSPAIIYEEADFLRHLSQKTGCHLLLNITNIFLNILNCKLNPMQYLDKLPKRQIDAIHISGIQACIIENTIYQINDNRMPISPEQWSFYQRMIEKINRKPTIVAWINENSQRSMHSPELALSDLMQAAFTAETIMRETHESTPTTT